MNQHIQARQIAYELLAAEGLWNEKRFEMKAFSAVIHRLTSHAVALGIDWDLVLNKYDQIVDGQDPTTDDPND